MNQIYLVTVLTDHERKRKGGPTSRLWGWYPTFDEAEKSILENHGDLFECLYDYAVIESLAPGVQRIAKVEKWYKADWEHRTGPNHPTIAPCEAPSWSLNLFNFFT